MAVWLEIRSLSLRTWSAELNVGVGSLCFRTLWHFYISIDKPGCQGIEARRLFFCVIESVEGAV
jgi:hypothetical protein